jgi:hypothetical protein
VRACRRPIAAGTSLTEIGQPLAAQDAALRAAGCAKIFSEKASGAKTDRAELRKAVSRLGEGDVLVVTRLDRLARSTRKQRGAVRFTSGHFWRLAYLRIDEDYESLRAGRVSALRPVWGGSGAAAGQRIGGPFPAQ